MLEATTKFVSVLLSQNESFVSTHKQRNQRHTSKTQKRNGFILEIGAQVFYFELYYPFHVFPSPTANFFFGVSWYSAVY